MKKKLVEFLVDMTIYCLFLAVYSGFLMMLWNGGLYSFFSLPKMEFLHAVLILSGLYLIIAFLELTRKIQFFR